MNASQKNELLRSRILARTGILVPISTAASLRRAELTLHRWAEYECGGSHGLASWCIERDEETGHPYMVTHWYDGHITRRRISDRETSTLRRVANLCESIGLHFHYQTDPRGCSLYVYHEPLSHVDYNKGVQCSV